jgi:hypothetical protein
MALPMTFALRARRLSLLTVLFAGSAGIVLACGDDDSNDAKPGGGPGAEDGAVPSQPPGSGDATADADAGPLYPTTDPKSWSGARLKREVWSGENTSLIQAFVDTARSDMRCAFRVAEDGVLRCLPLPKVGVQYLDDQCSESQIVAYTIPGTPDVTEMVADRGTECENRWSVYTLGPVIATADGGADGLPKRWQRNGEGACVGAGSLPEGYAIRGTTAKISATDFVGAKLITENAAGRIGRRIYMSDDGAGYPTGLWDRPLDTACTLRIDQDKKDRCMPGHFSGAFYGDSLCTTVIASKDECGVDPKFIHRQVGPSFPGPQWVEAHRVTGAIDGGTGRWQKVGINGETCVPLGSGPVTGFFTTAPMPKEDLVLVTGAWSGANRIQRWMLTADGVDLMVRTDLLPPGNSDLPPEQIFDKQLEVSCRLTKRGGEVKCLPNSLSGSMSYADDQCTQPVVPYSDPFNPSAAPPKFAELGTNGTDSAFYRLTTQRTIPKLYYKAPGCTEASPAPSGYKVYDLVGPEPMASFVTFVNKIE